MKNLLLTCFIIFISGCQTASNKQLSTMQQQLDKMQDVQTQIAIKVGLGELVRPDVIELSKDGVWVGSQSADIVIMEFTDLHCPYCKKFHNEVWPLVKEKYVDTNQVAILAREFPLASLHPKAPYAAVMLRCANQQGEYEAVKNDLFSLGNTLSKDSITQITSDYDLDETQFNACLKDTDVHNKVTESLKDAAALGLSSTPTFIIGRKVDNTITDYQIIKGAASLSQFSKIIDSFSSSK